MVANMTAISSHMKQPRHSSPRKGAASDAQTFAWPFKADARGAKPDMVGSSGMIPSPDDSSNSWEARAFAEDASSLAAGIWPPRAYPCSFCRREFRSAQALGGHMNVHRRDRARLRHSSPPVPLCAPLITNQPTSLFQAKKIYSVNPSARHTANDQPLIKLNTPAPISLSKSGYTATSFPLRLQQLASEAAASLCMYPQASESSDLLSLWPPSITTSVNFACQTNMRCSTTPAMKERPLEISTSSSLSSPPSSIVSCAGPPKRDAAAPNCRREAPIIRPEDENPKKKSHTENTDYSQSYGHMIIKEATDSLNHGLHAAADSLSHGLHAHDIQLTATKAATDQETCYSERRRELVPCSGEVDLELRLGRRPP